MTEYDFTFKVSHIEAESESQAYEKLQEAVNDYPEYLECSEDNYDLSIEEHKDGEETFWCTIAMSKDGVQLCKDNEQWLKDTPDMNDRNKMLMEMIKAKTVVFKMLMPRWHINSTLAMTHGRGKQGKKEAMRWVHSTMYSWFATRKFRTVVFIAPDAYRDEQYKLFDEYCVGHSSKGLMTKEVIAELA